MARFLFVYQICSFGGVETVLRNRSVGLRALGHEVRLLFLEDLGGGAAFSGLPGVEIAPARERRTALLHDPSVDVIATIDTPSVAPEIAARRAPARRVWEIHSNNFANMGYLARVDAKSADVLVVPSAYEGGLVRREYPALEASGIPLRVAPNPVDTTLFAFQPPSRVPADPVLAWVGRLEEQKNWPHFLDVAGQVARRRPRSSFVVVGGIAAPEAIKNEFRQIVTQNGLAGRLRWLPALAYSRMPAVYSTVAASGGCLAPTSRFEPFGMTVLEAQACRCPVVAARTGGLAELIEEETTGLGFDVDDTMGAVEQILRVWDDGDLRARVNNGATEAIQTRFAAEAAARTYASAVLD